MKFQEALRICSLSLASALILGCQTSIRSVPGVVELPQSFTRSGESVLPEQWWTSFDDPGLNAAIDMALQDNFDLRSAWDRLAQAQAIARSEGADLTPSVDGTAGIGRSYTQNSTTDSSAGSYALGLSMSYELDVWGRVRSVRDAAVFDAQASEQDLHAAAITLSASVATVWYQLGEQLEQIQLIQQQDDSNRKVLELLTLQFNQGQILAADVLRQKQLVEQTAGELTLAERDATITRHQLAVLLGRSPNDDLGLPDPELASLGPLPATGLPSELLQRRPDLLSAEMAILAADRDLATAIADQYPRVSLSASIETGGTQIRDIFDDWMANLAANLTQPLIDGGRREAEVDRNEALVSEAINAYGSAVLTAIQEVEDALSEESHQQRYHRSLVQQLETAGQVYERTRDSYLNGQLNYISVLDALISQQSLQREELSSRQSLLEARIELCRALAGSWELPQPKPFAMETTAKDEPRPQFE
ncbi:MAG: efflux transporter outer membrane subunit [Phycisphaerales bacterium JB047]